MDITQLLGFTGAALSIITYLPQVIKLWRTKSAKDISMPMLLLLTLGVAIWLAFGIRIKDIPLIITNSLILAMSLTMVILKKVYDKNMINQ